MLDRVTILAAFEKLSRGLAGRGVTGEINLLGGTAMVLGFQARQATKDLDAIFAPAPIIREQAREMDLPSDWLNDAAKGFLSPAGDFRTLPETDFPNLGIQYPSTEYMLAMKVMAARATEIGGGADKEDIRVLIRTLGLSTLDSVLDIVQAYYPPHRILPRSVYLVEEILEEEQAR